MPLHPSPRLRCDQSQTWSGLSPTFSCYRMVVALECSPTRRRGLQFPGDRLRLWSARLRNSCHDLTEHTPQFTKWREGQNPSKLELLLTNEPHLIDEIKLLWGPNVPIMIISLNHGKQSDSIQTSAYVSISLSTRETFTFRLGIEKGTEPLSTVISHT
ncbi:unnamed protein product [Dicrocoelium dendriticum]|nr:unnamed protein product [Dicrocoelium dendriticum]